MNQKPTRERVQALIRGIQARTEEVPDGRAGFALCAIYCQVNEGICPTITGGLRCGDFDFKHMHFEFAPIKGLHIVRRWLSEETAGYLQAQIKKFGRRQDDLIHGYVSRPLKRPLKHPEINFTRRRNGLYYRGLQGEVIQAGFSWEEFHYKRLGWIWRDQHPKLRDQELRSGLLAQSVLRWSPSAQQEALFRKIYQDIPVPRPSWAHPDWHKDAPKITANCDGGATCEGDAGKAEMGGSGSTASAEPPE